MGTSGMQFCRIYRPALRPLQSRLERCGKPEHADIRTSRNASHGESPRINAKATSLGNSPCSRHRYGPINTDGEATNGRSTLLTKRMGARHGANTGNDFKPRRNATDIRG